MPSRDGHLPDPSCKLGMWEIDGKAEAYYCENLCSLSKLFLKDKSAYNKTDNFYFYGNCEYDDKGATFVGYFSKEKESPQHYNSVYYGITPYPVQKGYGKFLISTSYELSKIDGNLMASPEKPLSDLGEKTYIVLVHPHFARDDEDEAETRRKDAGPKEHGVSIDEIWRATNINKMDIETALEYGGQSLARGRGWPTSPLQRN